MAQKHGGDWAGYLAKWSRQLANVKAIYGEGKGIKVPGSGAVVKGPKLSEYIGKLSQRVDINQCLSKLRKASASTTTKRISKKVLKVSPFGKGVNAYRAGDFKTAHDIWLPLANGGNAKAQNALGHLYRNGYGVEADLAKSRQWYTMSAAAGDRVGLFSLGDIARTTANTKNETAKAISLIKKSASLNYGKAQFSLAEIFHQGVDVPANDGEAYFWVSLALKNKYTKAQALKELLDKSLSAAEKKAQTERAQKMLALIKK